MNPFLAAFLKFIESVALGVAMVFFAVAIPGGIYELTTGSPSDGFFFDIWIYGFPLVLIGLVYLPIAIWKSPRLRHVSRCLLVTMIGLILLIGLLNQ